MSDERTGTSEKLEGDGYEVSYEWMDDTGVNINHFFVSPDRREDGVGSRVLNSILNEVRNEGAEYVVLNMKGGDAAAAFARQNDFRIVERESDRITAELELETDD